MSGAGVRRAIVVGGGIGGLSAAIALRQAGLAVAVYERAGEVREVGAGLILWPNAMQALALLGLDAAVRAASRPAGGAAIRSWRGDPLLDAIPRDLMHRQFGEPAAAIHRAELLEILVRAFGAADLHLGADATGYTQEGEKVTAGFADGRTATGDLLIGSDGIRSTIRQHLLPGARLRHSGYTAWRAVLPFALDSDHWWESFGRGERFGAGALRDTRVYWYATANLPAGTPDDPFGRKQELIERFRGWHDPIGALIAATEEEAILRNDLYDHDPLPRWSDGRVTLLGDAAHATTPNLGQGACMAIEDAVVLARCLRQSSDLPAALRAYEARRKPRTTAITLRSRRLGRIAQWEHPAACAIRDRLLARVPLRLRLRELRWLCSFE
jgi:2-polyprenyl-6-methoxyphenol hydroxylase-like FAD-dependent oxidoreductase